MFAQSKEMLIINPASELRFCGPFTRPIVTVMTLKNPTENVCLFKIKTTAPKRYCVRPNFGHLMPQSSTQVEICLQPFNYDINEKNKHKFMVQSLMVPEDSEDYPKLWKEAEPDQLMDAKLKCVFEMPAGGSSGDRAVDTTKDVPKTSDDEKISNLQTSEKSNESLMSEVREAMEEKMAMRKEILELQDQLMKLRSAPLKSAFDEPYAPVAAERQIPIFYIAIAIAMVFLGALLGKYLL